MALLNRETAERLLAAAWWLLLAFGTGLFVVVAVKTLLYPHEVAVSEGAVGLAVASVLDGVPLYGAERWLEPPWVIIHYTPLYYLITGAVAWVTGPGFLAGRLVSVVGTALTGGAAALFVYRRTGRIAPGLAAAAIWFSFYQVVFWGTIQRVDAVGILFEAIGLLAYDRARRDGRSGLGAVPWFAAAWATKQVMVVGLLACIVDRFRDDRREGVRFALAGFGPILGLMGLLILWSRGGFWTAAVLGTVSADADPPWVIFSNAELFFGSPWNIVLLVLATWAAWLRPGDRFLGVYLWLGLAVAVATDANLPRFFPPMLAMAILVPLLLDGARSTPRLRTALLLAGVLAALVHQPYEMRSLVRERVLTLHENNERLRLAEAVRRHTSPDSRVLAQDVGMLLSAEREVLMADPLVFSILVGNDGWRPDRIVEGIEGREYDAVILNRPLEDLEPEEWTTLWIYPARDALMENYQLVETVSTSQYWRFLEPTRFIYARKADPE